MRIGFIGLGNMGANMAMVLLRSGLELKVHDIDKSRAAEHIEGGARWADTPADCARDVDILITSLPKPDVVDRVMRGENGVFEGLGEGTIWVDTTTNDAGLVIELAEQAAGMGVKTIDSPVTGAVDGARRGELTLFAGGDEAALDVSEPILARLGRVIRCGKLGTGNAVKLVTNYLWFTHAAVIGEGLMLGKRAGGGRSLRLVGEHPLPPPLFSVDDLGEFPLGHILLADPQRHGGPPCVASQAVPPAPVL